MRRYSNGLLLPLSFTPRTDDGRFSPSTKVVENFKGRKEGILMGEGGGRKSSSVGSLVGSVGWPKDGHDGQQQVSPAMLRESAAHSVTHLSLSLSLSFLEGAAFKASVFKSVVKRFLVGLRNFEAERRRRERERGDVTAGHLGKTFTSSSRAARRCLRHPASIPPAECRGRAVRVGCAVYKSLFPPLYRLWRELE